MEDNSFVKVFRKMTDWEWYTDPLTAHLFIHLILKANYVDKVWKGIPIKRGEFITSVNVLSIESGITTQSVRTALNKLIKTNDIITQSTNKYTLVTICNYDVYQQNTSKDNNLLTSNITNQKQTSNKPITNEQQSTNNQLTTTKELEEYKEREDIEEFQDDDCDEKKSSSIIDEDFLIEVLKIWNSNVGDIVPKIKKLSEARKRQFELMLLTMGETSTQRLVLIKTLCVKIYSSDYLSGRENKTFSTDWDWVMASEDNWRKIYDGKYNTRKPNAKIAQPQRSVPNVEKITIKNDTTKPLKVLHTIPSLVKFKAE